MKENDKEKIDNLLKDNINLLNLIIKNLESKKDFYQTRFDEIEKHIKMLQNEVNSFKSEFKSLNLKIEYNEKDHEKLIEIINRYYENFQKITETLGEINLKIGNLDGRTGIIGTLTGIIGGFIAFLINNWRR